MVEPVTQSRGGNIVIIQSFDVELERVAPIGVIDRLPSRRNFFEELKASGPEKAAAAEFRKVEQLRGVNLTSPVHTLAYRPIEAARVEYADLNY